MVAKGEEGWRREGLGVWGQQMPTLIYRMDKQQGPTVEHRELYPVRNHNAKEYEKEYI